MARQADRGTLGQCRGRGSYVSKWLERLASHVLVRVFLSVPRRPRQTGVARPAEVIACANGRIGARILEVAGLAIANPRPNLVSCAAFCAQCKTRNPRPSLRRTELVLDAFMLGRHHAAAACRFQPWVLPPDWAARYVPLRMAVDGIVQYKHKTVQVKRWCFLV